MTLVSWDTLRDEAAELWTTRQMSTRRLQAALDLIADYRARGADLRPMLNNILTLLEASQTVPEVSDLALRVLLALDHWITALEHWPRWEAVLFHYGGIAFSRDSLDTAIVILKDLSEITRQQGRLTDALMLAQSGVAIADEFVAPDVTGQVLIKVVWTALINNDKTAAQAALEKAREIYDRLPPISQAILRGYLLFAGADYARRHNSLTEALSLARESVIAFEDSPRPHTPTQATAYRMYGIYEWAYGNYHTAIASLKKAASLYKSMGDEFSVGWTYGNMALVYRHLGQLDQAARLTRRGITISRRYEAHWQVLYEIGNLADVYLAMGHIQRARQVVGKHWAMSRKLNIRSEIIRAASVMAVINIRRGRYRAARRLLWAYAQYVRQHDRLEGLAIAYAALAQCYARLGHPWRAQVFGTEALRLSDRLDSKRLEIIALRALAEALPADQALTCLQRAVSLSDEGSFEQIAAEVALLRSIDDPIERETRWALYHDRLVEMGAGAELFGRDASHLPDLVVCL